MSFLGTLGPVVDVATSIADPILSFIGLKETNKANKKINDENLAAQKELQDRNLAYQTQMYERALADNSPSSMVRKYEEAGLNPYMMMQDGQWNSVSQPSGSAASVPASIPMQSPDFDFSGIGASFDRFYNNRYKEEEIKNLSFQNDFAIYKLISDLNEQEQDIIHKKNLNSQDEEQLQTIKLNRKYLEKTLKYRISQQRSDADLAQANADQASWSYFENMTLWPYKKELQASGMRMSWKQEQQLDANLRKTYREIRNLAAQYGLTNAQKRAVMQDIRIKNQEEKYQGQGTTAFAYHS